MGVGGVEVEDCWMYLLSRTHSHVGSREDTVLLVDVVNGSQSRLLNTVRCCTSFLRRAASGAPGAGVQFVLPPISEDCHSASEFLRLNK